jgi:hypothetical protein
MKHEMDFHGTWKLGYNATSFIFFMMVNGPSLGSPISQKI